MVEVVAGAVVVVAAAGLVAGVEAGFVDREGASAAGLEVVTGGFRSADGEVWASATEASANRLVIDKVIGLMWGALW